MTRVKREVVVSYLYDNFSDFYWGKSVREKIQNAQVLMTLQNIFSLYFIIRTST